MKKSGVFFSVFLLFVSLGAHGAIKKSMDGLWKGKMVFDNVPTSYELTVLAKTVGGKLVLEAKTEYADLTVTRAKLSASKDDATKFDAEMFEYVKMPDDDSVYFFRFELRGKFFSEDLIKGHVDYSSSWSPYLHTDSGSLILRRVSEK